MESVGVDKVIADMNTLVDRGDFAQAANIGNRAEVPLGVAQADIGMTSELSQGTQSTVFEGKYQNQHVAIKKAKIGKSADLDSFKLEVAIMFKLRHVSSVVSLIAARLVPPGYLLVMPYIPENLYSKIHHDGWRPEWPTVLQLSTHLAVGVAAVHKAGILHRDLKPGNVLLDQNARPYICDFGIAMPMAELQADDARGSMQGKPSGGLHKRNMMGTLEYMAPETLQKQKPSAKSDVWALAVLLNEVATGVFPYSDCTQENPAAHTVLEMGYGRQELATAIATDGLLPLTKDDTPASFAAMLKACWSLHPADRPSAHEMLLSLQAMQAEHWAPDGPHHQPAAEPSQEQEPLSMNAAAAVADKAACHSPDRHSAQPRLNGGIMSQDASMAADQTYHPQVTAGSFATAGLRGEDRMEDRHVIQEGLAGCSNCHLVAVFDGHRGSQAAAYAAQHVVEQLQASLAVSGLAEACADCFVSLDRSVRQQQDLQWQDQVKRMGARAAGKRSWPGCTALAVLVKGNVMVVANAGDCRAVLCTAGKAKALSCDHTADKEEERQRVQAAGASVQWKIDSWRIGEAGMQVTRSLGDADLKPAVTAQPEVVQHQLSSQDEFVVVASDGLWDKLTNQEAVGLVYDTVKQPAMAAQRLATEALTRGSTDNITVVVAFLRPVETLESVFKGGKQKHTATATFYSSRKHSQPSVDEMCETR
ncbi:hypothetical protein ABBQ32_000038 [Trebouxia sp. C0010 RCD-2024]